MKSKYFPLLSEGMNSARISNGTVNPPILEEERRIKYRRDKTRRWKMDDSDSFAHQK